MTYQKFLNNVTKGLPAGTFKNSITGMIQCYEKMGLTVKQAADRLSEALLK